MRRTRRVFIHPGGRPAASLPTLLAALSLVLAPVVVAQDADTDEDRGVSLEEDVVVTASRTVERVVDAPVAVSVVGEEEFEFKQVRNYGDAMRNVPGVNFVQFGTRDVQITPRAAAGSLSTGQLALVDGRSIYQDFFGLVLWDLAPVHFDEISQVEVVRGPGSAVWGANALNGVIHVRTKSPKDSVGYRGSIGFGNRDLFTANFAWADTTGPWAYKLSASYYEQKDWDHAEAVNGIAVPFTFNTPGAEQPKFDVRVDRELEDAGRLIFKAGMAESSGLTFSPLGPFDTVDASSLSYIQALWEKADRRLTFFVNFFEGDTLNLFSSEATLNDDGFVTQVPNAGPLTLLAETTTYDLSYGDGTLLNDTIRLVYGGNVRLIDMDLSVAPGGDTRTEGGVYGELQFLFNDHIWWNVGGRFDYFNYSGSVDVTQPSQPLQFSDTIDVDRKLTRFTPRTSVILRASDNHSFRIGYGQAFRVPSLVESFISAPIAVGTGEPILPTVTVAAFGNPDLDEERLESFDISYNGNIRNRFTVSASYYYTVTEDSIDFTSRDTIDIPFLPPPTNVLPVTLTYVNLGVVRNSGLETAFALRISPWVQATLNYTFQRTPNGNGLPATFVPSLGELREPINDPPRHTYTTEITFDRGRFFGSVSGSYRDRTLWTDVLDERFWGETGSWFWTNALFGVRFMDERLTWQVSGTNVFDNRTQTHIFGDEIGGLVTTELKFKF